MGKYSNGRLFVCLFHSHYSRLILWRWLLLCVLGLFSHVEAALLSLLVKIGVLAAQYELLCELHSMSVSSETFEMIGRWTHYALKDLDRVAWDTTTTAVVERASEPIEAFVVDIEVYILILLETRVVIVFVAGTYDALFYFFLIIYLEALLILVLLHLIRISICSVEFIRAKYVIRALFLFRLVTFLFWAFLHLR